MYAYIGWGSCWGSVLSPLERTWWREDMRERPTLELRANACFPISAHTQARYFCPPSPGLQIRIIYFVHCWFCYPNGCPLHIVWSDEQGSICPGPQDRDCNYAPSSRPVAFRRSGRHTHAFRTTNIVIGMSEYTLYTYSWTCVICRTETMQRKSNSTIVLRHDVESWSDSGYRLCSAARH